MKGDRILKITKVVLKKLAKTDGYVPLNIDYIYTHPSTGYVRLGVCLHLEKCHHYEGNFTVF